MQIYPLKFKQSSKPCLYVCKNIATTDTSGKRLHILDSITGKSRKSVLDSATLITIKYRMNNSLPV